jgi:hypothetical protein
MSTHVRVLGGLFMVFSAFGLLAALVVGIGIGGAAGIVGATGDADPLVIPILGIAGSIAIIVLLALSLPGLIAGIGLLTFQSWARILGIVLCAICLIGIPFGTIFGVYGLWVLLTKDTERLFEPAVTR